MLTHTKSTVYSSDLVSGGGNVCQCVNADKTSMVLFTNNKKLVSFKKPILFGTELQLKNQVNPR
jgi:hypothetical protein